MVTYTTVQLWSKAEQSIAEWTVSTENDPSFQVDPGDEPVKVIILRHNDEICKFSPNTTDDELMRVINQMNQDKG